MSTIFRCYVDESGDEGFKFGAGSSEWFVLTGFIVRRSDDLTETALIERVRQTLGKPIGEVARAKAWVVSVCVWKPHLLEQETFQERYRLYYYTARYLIERVSWIARDHKRPHDPTDGKIEFVFSNRGGMSYKELKDYLDLLRRQTESGQDIRIEWQHVGVDKITALSPMKRRGLLIADACASAFFEGLEPKYGYVEPRYAEMLKSIVYYYDGKRMGYGLKVVPREALVALRSDALREWVNRY